MSEELLERFIQIRSENSKYSLEVIKLRNEIEKLKNEIYVLRQFGNKDCTAMADAYLAKEVKDGNI